MCSGETQGRRMVPAAFSMAERFSGRKLAQKALEWAFATERVSVDFDEFAAPSGADTIWRLIQRGLLGRHLCTGVALAAAS